MSNDTRGCCCEEGSGVTRTWARNGGSPNGCCGVPTGPRTGDLDKSSSRMEGTKYLIIATSLDISRRNHTKIPIELVTVLQV